jgi:hypothetical protein
MDRDRRAQGDCTGADQGPRREQTGDPVALGGAS